MTESWHHLERHREDVDLKAVQKCPCWPKGWVSPFLDGNPSRLLEVARRGSMPLKRHPWGLGLALSLSCDCFALLPAVTDHTLPSTMGRNVLEPQSKVSQPFV